VRIAAIVITFVGVARPAIADEAHCGRFASLPPRRPLSGQLRWDIGAGAEALVTGSRFDAELDVGVTKILDYAYQSLDLGVHATVGGAMTSPRAYLETIEIALRYYPVKLRQAFGIDECGDGTKSRRWSEHSDGAGYLSLRTGYGHLGGDVPAHDGWLISPSFGYEWNLGEGRTTSLFVQLGWRFDVIGNSSDIEFGGPLVELGLRL
jgi:hypothetical protein